MSYVVITFDDQSLSTARDLARELEIAGYAVWYRWRDGCAGPSIVGQNHRRIEECAAVVVVLCNSVNCTSPWALASSDWMLGDIRTARQLDKSLIFVLGGISEEDLRSWPSKWAEIQDVHSTISVSLEGVRAAVPQLIETLTRLGIKPTVVKLPDDLAEKVNRYRLPAVRDVYGSIEFDDAKIPRDAALKYKAVPLENIGGVVVAAMSDPSLAGEVRDRYFPFDEFEPVLATEEAIIAAIDKFYADRGRDGAPDGTDSGDEEDENTD